MIQKEDLNRIFLANFFVVEFACRHLTNILEQKVDSTFTFLTYYPYHPNAQHDIQMSSKFQSNIQDTPCNFRSRHSCYLRTSVVALAKNQMLWQDYVGSDLVILAKHILLHYFITLLADIALNPGPSTYFKCGTCLQPVTWEQDGVQCDDYETWFHTPCETKDMLPTRHRPFTRFAQGFAQNADQ